MGCSSLAAAPNFEAALQTVDDSGSRQTLSYKCAVRP